MPRLGGHRWGDTISGSPLETSTWAQWIQLQDQHKPAPPTSPKFRVSTGVQFTARGAALLSKDVMKTSYLKFSALWCSPGLLGSCSVQEPQWSSPPWVQILLINQHVESWGKVSPKASRSSSSTCVIKGQPNGLSRCCKTTAGLATPLRPLRAKATTALYLDPTCHSTWR